MGFIGGFRLAGLGLAALCASMVLRGDSGVTLSLQVPASVARQAPQTILWAWEEPEDLRTVDPERVGVAFLAERVFLGETAQISPRRQSILVPDRVFAIAVVRIESTPGFADSSKLRAEAADAVLRAAELPNIRGVQIDFDAAASQREFYAEVLRQVRSRLPAQMGLTMTALLSWCASSDGWLRNLPVDAAVPMYFRLGKHSGQWGVQESRCAGNVGISIDEPGRAQARVGARRYVFSPRPWTVGQLAVLNREGYPGIARSTP